MQLRSGLTMHVVYGVIEKGGLVLVTIGASYQMIACVASTINQLIDFEQNLNIRDSMNGI